MPQRFRLANRNTSAISRYSGLSARAPSRTVTATSGILFSVTAKFRSSFGQAKPDIAKHDEDEHRHIQKQAKPTVKKLIETRAAAHRIPMPMPISIETMKLIATRPSVTPT